ncbi:MAG: class I SAM-dependent methyltransferase [Spirochaetales bacterium]|jgi:ubiquinone/menaquinone biosynthesis C-methylase UbiE|nr:class I SAM-dependent methyltransferase [Spirochaetales bacterium]
MHDKEDTYFGTVAEHYDGLQPIIAGPHYATGIDTIIKLIPYGPGAVFAVVELGCGTATIAEKILSTYDNARAVVVDAQPAMLEIAKAKLLGYVDRADVVEADLLDCSIPECDIIVSSFTLHHLSPTDLQVLLTRMRESLSADGYLLVMDSMRMDHDWDDHISRLNRSWNEVHVRSHIEAGETTEEEIAKRWAFKRKMKEEGKDTEYKHRVEEYYQYLKQAGFMEYAVVWRTFLITILVAAGM